MKRKRGRREAMPKALWTKDEAGKLWLTETGQKIPLAKEQFSRKSIERATTGGLRVWRENPPVTFAELRPNDILDTGDLVRHFGCSLVTLYRWIAMRELKPSMRIGRELFFKKSDVEQWEKQSGRPRPGRPRAKRR